jgi:hypothetical protein
VLLFGLRSLHGLAIIITIGRSALSYKVKSRSGGDKKERMKRLCLLVAAATIVAAPAFAADDTITIGFTASRTGRLNVDSTSIGS